MIMWKNKCIILKIKNNGFFLLSCFIKIFLFIFYLWRQNSAYFYIMPISIIVCLIIMTIVSYALEILIYLKHIFVYMQCNIL